MNDRTQDLEAFISCAGWRDAERIPLTGDASTRRYIRLKRRSETALVMDQPQNAEAPAAAPGATPEERRALGYNAVARLAGADCGRFVAASDWLRGLGLSAPAVYTRDLGRGFLLLEDLGDALYADVIPKGADEAELYGAAAEVLAKIHAASAPSLLPPDKPLYAYDETALLAEVELLTEWFFPVALGREASEGEKQEFLGLWREALAPVLSSPPVFVHRDYHAQNLVWLPKRRGPARVGLIDFQDAVAGPRAYDLISLIEDARREVAPALRQAATARYMAAMREQGTPVNEEAFALEMAVFAAQRNTKIAGIFARLYKRDGKGRYLAFLPRVWTYLTDDLAHPALKALKSWYDRSIPAAARQRGA